MAQMITPTSKRSFGTVLNPNTPNAYNTHHNSHIKNATLSPKLSEQQYFSPCPTSSSTPFSSSPVQVSNPGSAKFQSRAGGEHPLRQIVQEYSVEFPVGPMGLELEPVILSSQRKIGCRVKDFYFGVNHSGIDPTILQSRVSPGDIIVKIQGETVLSSKFHDILDMLKSLKEQSRIVVFKKIDSSSSKLLNIPF